MSQLSVRKVDRLSSTAVLGSLEDFCVLIATI